MSLLSRRAQQVQPFHVMDILAQARMRAAAGESIIHLEIGEPDFPTPQPIVDAGIAALRAGHTYYTESLGLPALRAAIAAQYRDARVTSARVAITHGSSGALLLALAALLDSGDEVLLPDPGYPCNANFVTALGGVAKRIAVDAANGYCVTPAQIRSHWSARTKAVLLASPANPTGAIIDADALRAIIETVNACGGRTIVDEIYHGLTYDTSLTSAAQLSDNVYVVNSFSKYFGMTGWRLGWLIAPTEDIAAIDRLAQNFFLAANTPAQHAALVAFDPEVTRELEQRRRIFQERRDYLVPALRELGFAIPLLPQGAFYVYADCSRFTDDSMAFAQDLLAATGVAITPGIDFGTHAATTHVRFAYANTLENLQQAVRRIGDFIASGPGRAQ